MKKYLDANLLVTELRKKNNVDTKGYDLPDYVDGELFSRFMRVMRAERAEDIADISDDELFSMLENLGNLSSVLDFDHKMDNSRLNMFRRKRSVQSRRCL